METLSNLESFVRSAESSSFSSAARQLALTPAAVSRNVAQLERNLGVRLFQRSTRGLKLTEEGERFLRAVSSGLDSIQGAIAELTTNKGEPAGVLTLSMPPRFGRQHLLPLLQAYKQRYPAVTLDCSFDNRQVDLIADRIDVAIGGGFELTPGVVARVLAPAHAIAVASPAYVQGLGTALPRTPADLAQLDGVMMRSPQTRRMKTWTMRNRRGTEMPAELRPALLVNDPDAICAAALMGMGVALLAMPDVIDHLERGELVRLLPDWYVDAGPISLYFTSQKLMPAKTRTFVDFVTESFKQAQLAQRFTAR
ncbi:LysR family transcriptional regulator [Pseudoduganella sp. FT55W]|uniref:LysR family transcriptional regulator n=1 Tax=Duganella rivi TaxID=2666083 RepID=A0A7X4GKY5_9BURK|nr:LysR family transcriptional regulator [Duganella rivi]MYM65396.1 LysR family transcriptional regulator [Duganella rivi]